MAAAAPAVGAMSQPPGVPAVILTSRPLTFRQQRLARALNPSLRCAESLNQRSIGANRHGMGLLVAQAERY